MVQIYTGLRFGILYAQDPGFDPGSHILAGLPLKDMKWRNMTVTTPTCSPSEGSRMCEHWTCWKRGVASALGSLWCASRGGRAYGIDIYEPMIRTIEAFRPHVPAEWNERVRAVVGDVAVNCLSTQTPLT